MPRLTERVLDLYHAELLRTGSHLLARHQVAWHLKLTPERVDRIVAADRAAR